MHRLFLVLALTLPLPAWADDLPREIAGPVDARVIKVRDGDTVEVEAFIWPMQSVQVAVRLRSVDAPELKGECEAERRSAEEAKARLQSLVGAGPVQLRRVSGDKYFGRVLAELGNSDEADIGARLLKEGYVQRYDGGRRRNWCADVGSNERSETTRAEKS